MVRLNALVEGSTEEGFVNRVLAAHLGQHHVFVRARRVETSRQRRYETVRIYRGGLRSYEPVRADLKRWMKEDNRADAFFTTMFDLYALPEDFPGYDAARHLTDPYQRIEALELAMAEDVDHQRFIPYLQLHEFEALVLSEPRRFDWEYIEPRHEGGIAALEALRASVASPELINDGPNTAPSKRILNLIPEYSKAVAGPLIAGHIGIEAIRSACPHFNRWILGLERLGSGGPP